MKLRKKQPKLLNKHKIARLEFAKKHQTWCFKKWKRVVFSDEKKFNLDGPDGFQKFWFSKEIKQEYFSKRHTEGGSLMVWGAFSAKGKLKLIFLNGCQTSKDYIKMLSKADLQKMVKFWVVKSGFFNKTMHPSIKPKNH